MARLSLEFLSVQQLTVLRLETSLLILPVTVQVQHEFNPSKPNGISSDAFGGPYFLMSLKCFCYKHRSASESKCARPILVVLHTEPPMFLMGFTPTTPPHFWDHLLPEKSYTRNSENQERTLVKMMMGLTENVLLSWKIEEDTWPYFPWPCSRHLPDAL